MLACRNEKEVAKPPSPLSPASLRLTAAGNIGSKRRTAASRQARFADQIQKGNDAKADISDRDRGLHRVTRCGIRAKHDQSLGMKPLSWEQRPSGWAGMPHR